MTIRYLYPQGYEPLEQRSVGDVPAPVIDHPELGRLQVIDHPELGRLQVIDHPELGRLQVIADRVAKATQDDIVEKLATSVERVAVVKYLRACGFGSGSVHWRLADDIERGEHTK